MSALAPRDMERILAQEVRRFGGAMPGYDREDLRQEARFAVHKYLEPEAHGARSFVRMAVRHRLSHILRHATAAARCPRDSNGAPQLWALRPTEQAHGGLDATDEPWPDARLEAEQAVSYLRDRLDPRDWAQLVQALRGEEDEDSAALVDARVRAAALLDRIGYRVTRDRRSSRMYPQPDAKTPACHPDRTEPQGYDPALDAPCTNCRDKFTCLPRSIEKGLVQLTRKADLEVDAVVDGRMTYADAVARMKRRMAKTAQGAELVAEDLATWTMLDEPRADPEPAPAATVDAAPAAEAAPAAQEDDDMKKPGSPVQQGRRIIGHVRKTVHGWGWYATNGSESATWFASKDEASAALARSAAAKAKAKPEKRKAAKPEKPSKAKPSKTKAPKAKPEVAAAEKTERPDGWPSMSNGKPLPQPKRLSEEEMQAVLADVQTKLGANITLEYGMSVVRRKRGAADVVAVITPRGFETEIDESAAKAAGFDERWQTFGSLSSVAMWAERRMVSGNDFFNLAVHNCTEIRDKHGRIIDRKGGVAPAPAARRR